MKKPSLTFPRILVPGLVAVIMMIRSMFIATKGRRIAAYPDPRKALVVLDIQEGYDGTNTRQPVTIPPATGLIAATAPIASSG